MQINYANQLCKTSSFINLVAKEIKKEAFMSNKKYSLLYQLESSEYKKLSPTALHDLGLDQICKQLTPKESEQNLIMNTMSKLCADPFVTQYRCDIFEDMIHHKEMRTIYNTHMHKLAFDIDEINEEDYEGKAFSLVVHNEGEKRSYKIEIAPPIGKSFASDIARKYGVTYEMLTQEG